MITPDQNKKKKKHTLYLLNIIIYNQITVEPPLGVHPQDKEKCVIEVIKTKDYIDSAFCQHKHCPPLKEVSQSRGSTVIVNVSVTINIFAGLSTALVERDDFSSGTSSRSTKLIHGGVRYLQKAIMQLDREQVNYSAIHIFSLLLSPALGSLSLSIEEAGYVCLVCSVVKDASQNCGAGSNPIRTTNQGHKITGKIMLAVLKNTAKP